MDPGGSKASRTAEKAAILRAAHQVLDYPRLIDDPLALRIVDERAVKALLESSSPWSSYIRAFLVARSRYAEDALAEALSRGVRQCILLGAGLDTFAFRQPYPSGLLRIFEVDHPDTQIVKLERLHSAGVEIPENVIFVPVDLEKRHLREALLEAGYDEAEAAFFSWLGVTEYLAPETVRAILRFIASGPIGNTVVFDYLVPPSQLNPSQRRAFDILFHRVEAAGEPWRSFFRSEELGDDLKAMGFTFVSDLGPEELNEMYFKGRKDGLRVAGFSRIAFAKV